MPVSVNLYLTSSNLETLSGFFLNSLGRMKKSICWVMGPKKAKFGKWSWISPEQIVELVACSSKTARIGILVLLVYLHGLFSILCR